MLLVILAGCDFAPPAPDWTDQLAPSGPCYEADLLDGLDETSTAELHAVWGCLDRQGALAGFAPVETAFDAETREGPAGLVIARWVNAQSLDGLSLSAWVDDALAVLDEPQGLFDLLDLALELAYGAPRAWLGVEVPVAGPGALDAGPLVPLLGTAGEVATVALDQPEAFDPVLDLLRSEALVSLAWTASAMVESDDAEVAGVVDRWGSLLADTVRQTRDPANDRWAEATGDSLRDLVRWLVERRDDRGETLLHALGEAAAPLLADADAGRRLQEALRGEAAAGRLAPLFSQLAWLVGVDARGESLAAGEPSALVALVRLLHRADVPVDCSIDLGFTSIDWSLGNLSEALLDLIAGLDPDTAASGVGLLGQLLGFGVSEDVLYAVADSGVCPAVDRQLVDDLHAIDRLAEADALLRVLLAVLDVFADDIPALVDALGAAYTLGVLEPLEEVVRDLGDAGVDDELVVVVEVLLEPDRYLDRADVPATVSFVDLPTVWGWLPGLLVPDADGTTPLDDMSALTGAVLGRSTTWEAVGALATLLAEPEAELHGVLTGLPEALAEDPELTVATSLADTLADRDATRPLWVLVEADGVRAALTAADPGPVPTLAGWTLDGTLDALIQTLQLLASLLDDPEAP